MKKFGLLLLMTLTVPIGMFAQSVDDDLYYTPDSKGGQALTTTPRQRSSTATVNSNSIDVDSYNRQYSSNGDVYNSEKNDTLYIDDRANSSGSNQMTDSITNRRDENGRWVNGFTGNADDYEYAMRIVRFHNPRYAVSISSPLYWDLVNGLNSWDWNVYDDGMYAYAFPTWTNNSWWNWRYGPTGWWGYSSYYGFGSPWSYGWYGDWYGYYGGWNSPYYYGYGWGGLGRPYSRGGYGWSGLPRYNASGRYSGYGGRSIAGNGSYGASTRTYSGGGRSYANNQGGRTYSRATGRVISGNSGFTRSYGNISSDVTRRYGNDDGSRTYSRPSSTRTYGNAGYTRGYNSSNVTRSNNTNYRNYNNSNYTRSYSAPQSISRSSSFGSTRSYSGGSSSGGGRSYGGGGHRR